MRHQITAWRGCSSSARPCDLPHLAETRGRERDEHLRRLGLQRLRDPDDIHEGDVAFGALDLADVVAVEAGQLGEPLLRQTSRRPELAETFAKQAKDFVAHS